jgi:hypothetical protein
MSATWIARCKPFFGLRLSVALPSPIRHDGWFTYHAMQRLLISTLSIAAIAGSAAAQPAPDPQPDAPANPEALPVVPPPAELAPVVAPAPAPAPVEPAKPADSAKKIAVGKDSPGAFFTPGVLLQGWFVDDFASTAGDNSTTVSTLSTFRFRRAELSANGELIPKFLKYRMMFDPSRVRDTLNKTTAVDATGAPIVVSTPASAISTLQDFFITFQSEYADVSIGQFKIPVGWESYNASAKLILPERAFVSTVLADKRDVGIRIEKTFDKFGYSAGVFNGAGQNNFDNNNQKDVALRLEAYPVKGMTIAGVAYDSVGYRSRAGTKDRWEGDFRYETGPFLIQAEYLRGVDLTKNLATTCANAAGKCTSQGAYAALAYKIKGVGAGNWKGDFQPVVRVGFFDPDADNDVTAMTPAANARMDYEIGANYYLRNHEAKLQVSYDRQQFEDSDIKTAGNELILAVQLWY